ncbi:MAG: alpha/beta fold hydrolase [Gallionella sp.]|nr:alpha/beta fold hydrolase [Gallionella sp.]MDD4947669.1 alpha/beta fold hydrolase [Gallionella sp.]MDD5612246.1 alpha/beta fold hydrolase [Gallionella sp.]
MATQGKITLTGPAGQIEGALHQPDGEPLAIVVVAHPLPTMGGTMENKVVTTLARTFAELGFVVLRFNFRGVGASEGEFDSGNGEVEDLLAVVQHAQDAFGHLPLILSGFSFGGYVAARTARHLHPQPHKLVLIAPAVGRFEMPPVPHNTLVIHGEQDEVISLADAFAWARPQHLPILVLPEAGHFFHGRLQQLKQLVIKEFNGCRL